MNNFEYLINYKIGILMSILLFLLGSHADAFPMGGKETISVGGNIGGMFNPPGATILINGNMPSINAIGGPFIAPLGFETVPGMNSPAASISGTDLIGAMNNIIIGTTGGQVMLPGIFPAMGQIPLSLFEMHIFTNTMISGIIGPYALDSLMMGPNPTNPLIMWSGPMCPLSMGPNLMGPLIMCPGPIYPFMIRPDPMNIMVMPGPMNSLKIKPYPIKETALGFFPPNFTTISKINPFKDPPSTSKTEPKIRQTEDCISQTIFKTEKKGNITFLEVHDGCTGKIYHGYPAGAWLPGVLTTSPHPVVDYRWWYGCSPTCAGMMMAYYDKNPYNLNGIVYDLIPGGFAEDESFLNPDPWYSANPFLNELVKLCNMVIASKEHALDFWTNPDDPSAGFRLNEDPLASIRAGDPAGFNCLADFMGASQNNLSGTRGNPDGITWFWFSSDGSILSSDSESWPGWYDFNYSGMHGLVEWARYCQIISGQSMNAYAYNQYIEGYTPPSGPAPAAGFSFSDYQLEIDCGRPVMFLLMDWDLDAAHSVLGVGYGYDPANQRLVYINDTWSLNDPADPKTIPWANGSYLYTVVVSGTLHTFNFEIMGVTTFRPI